MFLWSFLGRCTLHAWKILYWPEFVAITWHFFEQIEKFWPIFPQALGLPIFWYESCSNFLRKLYAEKSSRWPKLCHLWPVFGFLSDFDFDDFLYSSKTLYNTLLIIYFEKHPSHARIFLKWQKLNFCDQIWPNFGQVVNL